MTVTYTTEVATLRGFGHFHKLLLRWRGSIYKIIWKDMILFLFLYYVLNIIYRFYLHGDNKRTFEYVVRYCFSNAALIPLSFILGFYVSLVMERWWDQFAGIPWPDGTAVYVSSMLHGYDDHSREMRRTIMRYVCLCLTLVFREMTPSVRSRFPTLDHLVEGGHMLENEKEVLEAFNQQFPKQPNQWMPIIWAASILTCARREGRIRDDFSLKTIVDALNNFRGACGNLLHYNYINIPLVYTQAVTLAVYTFFLCAVLGAQWVERPDNASFFRKIDIYFPIFGLLEFFFYLGWLKVAETLINPFGDNDENFELNSIIDRNLQVVRLIVDEMHQEHPDLMKDQYWDTEFPSHYDNGDVENGQAVKEPKEIVVVPNNATNADSMSKFNTPSTLSSAAITSSDNLRYEERFIAEVNYTTESDVEVAKETTIAREQQQQEQEQEEPESKQTGEQKERTITFQQEPQSIHELFRRAQTDVSSQSSEYEGPQQNDAFERLRAERMQEREERQVAKFVKNIANASNVITELAPDLPVAVKVSKAVVPKLKDPEDAIGINRLILDSFIQNLLKDLQSQEDLYEEEFRNATGENSDEVSEEHLDT